MPLRLRVTSHHGNQLGEARLREFVACGGTIGRALDNDWVLPDSKRFVSSHHALIDYQGGAYYLVDTSRNGVFVNDSDAAVGRGHPQRLVDGDRLRLGEYEIAIEIPAARIDTLDDGMPDLAELAELVPVDESMELMLVDESKLRAFEYNALEKLTKPDVEPSLPRKPAKAKEPAPPATAVRPPAVPTGNALAVDIFCRAAGLKASDLRGSNPDEVLEAAGALMRELLTGLADLLQSRSHVKDTLHLPQTIIGSSNNPIKFSPSVQDALRYLLGEQGGQSYLPADLAVQSAFRDVRNHQQALVRAVIHAIADYVERFEPDTLREGFDRGLNRTGLLAGANRLKYWDFYEQTYRAYTEKLDGEPLPHALIEALGTAYEREASDLGQVAGRDRPAQAS